MVPILGLWLPILLAAVLVFVASSVVHMMLPYHRSDYRAVPDEAGVMAALRPFNIPPGDYFVPLAGDPAQMRTTEHQEKMRQGPVFVATVFPNGMSGMGAQLTVWFIYCAVVGLFVAYLASRTLPPGAEYLTVFRLTGTVAFAGYALALPQASIWYRKSWSTTLKSMFDGLLYASLTAGVFAWRWPAG